MDFEKVTQLAESCLLPTLKINIGDQQITQEHFSDLQPILKSSLCQLLDTFHANEAILLEVDTNTLKFRQLFLMVICEQAAPNTIFQVQDDNIKKAIQSLSNRLLPEVCHNDTQLEQAVLEYFKIKLNKEGWKKNLGAVYGFLHYCHTCFGCNQDPLKLDSNSIQFLLSRGLCFSDHFEPEFKMMALQVFTILISPTYRNSLKEMNVDKVIYTEVFNMIEKAKELNFIQLLWSCLFTLINYEEKSKQNRKDFMTWSQFDDTFEKLLCRVGFEDNKEFLLVYMKILKQFLCIGRTESIDGDPVEVVKELRNIRKPNYRIFRWVRKLLMLFQNEGFKLGGTVESVLNYLWVSFTSICSTRSLRPAPQFLY